MIALILPLLMTCTLCAPSDTPPPLPTPPAPRTETVFIPYDQPPRLLNRGEVSAAFLKAYPPELRTRRVEATVMLWIQIDGDGKTMNVSVAERSGNALLDSAAVRVGGVMRWSPALKNGVGVGTTIQLPVVFSTQRWEKMNKESRQ